MTQDELRRKCEEEARKCRWDIGFEPPIGDPRNKDFMEADVKKITEALLHREMEIERLSKLLYSSNRSGPCKTHKEFHQGCMECIYDKACKADSLQKKLASVQQELRDSEQREADRISEKNILQEKLSVARCCGERILKCENQPECEELARELLQQIGEV